VISDILEAIGRKITVQGWFWEKKKKNRNYLKIAKSKKGLEVRLK
jgi:hypothetical protein